MTLQDTINGGFELMGGWFVVLNILRLLRDRQVKGIHLGTQLFFASWGIWNVYYYPHLGQWASLAGGLFLCLANLTWLALWAFLSAPIGTRSVLLGAHCIFLHPFFVARAWCKLYGFPLDPRLWFAFFLHDVGYIGQPNMDGPEGERHPIFGARIMGFLFDSYDEYLGRGSREWYDFVLLHSRHFAKKLGRPFSRLCVADKLAFCVTPKWLYLPMVKFTGELDEYLANAKFGASKGVVNTTPSEWWDSLSSYMQRWVAEHRDGKEDTWTAVNRHLGEVDA
jgi:hypothetical protein